MYHSENDSQLKTTTSPKLQQQSVSSESEAKPHLTLEGNLNLSDYVQDVPLPKVTVEEVAIWSNRNREVTRTNLAMWLVKVFSFTLGGTALLAGLAAFVPNADKAFIKEVIPQVITPQATLLGVALTFYFTSKEEK